MNPKTRVLIVDNDVAMAKYLAAHLSRRNFEVTVGYFGLLIQSWFWLKPQWMAKPAMTRCSA